MSKKDFYLAAIIGFLFGLLVLLPARNLDFPITPRLIFVSAIGFTLFAPAALFLLHFLSRFWAALYEFGKFAAVGALNTMLDLGVLNLLIAATGIATGLSFSFFKAVSFLTAVTNSYFWNKLWTFGSRAPFTLNEYGRFALATFIGLLINVGVASLVAGIGSGFFDKPKLWANIAGLVATFTALIWNFIAYKYIIFSAK